MVLFCTMSDAMCSCLQINRGEKEGTFILFVTKMNHFFVYPNLIAGMSENSNLVQYLYLCQEGHVTAGVCLSVHITTPKSYKGDFYESFRKCINIYEAELVTFWWIIFQFFQLKANCLWS